MSRSLASGKYQLPSVQRFIDSVIEDLARRSSVLVLLPRGVNSEEIWSVIEGKLWQRDISFRTLEVAGNHSQQPNTVVMQLLGVPNTFNPTEESIADLANIVSNNWSEEAERVAEKIPASVASGMSPDVLELTGMDQLGEQEQHDWSEYLVKWAKESQYIIDRGKSPMALCIVASANAVLKHLPKANVFFAIHWWWGFPCGLEERLLVRMAHENFDWDPVARWREYILPSLAGNDIALIEYLWDDFELDLKQLEMKLVEYAKQQGWDVVSLKRMSIDFSTNDIIDRKDQLLSPPLSIRPLWGTGALGLTSEYGLEGHAAALALCGRNEEWQHRLWRGQAELLLPLIDQVRLKICVQLTRKHGNDWPVRWINPISSEENLAVRRSALVCQLGHLENLLGNCPELRSERHWLMLVSLSRWVRNELAHYRPILFKDFANFLHKCAELG